MANTFKSAATGSRTDLTTMYTCPAATTSVVHAIYLSNIDGTNDATVAGVKKWHFDEDDGYFLQNVGIGASPTEKLSVISSTASTRGILELKNTGDNHTFIVSDSNLSGAGSGMGGLRGYWNGSEVSRISFETLLRFFHGTLISQSI